MADEFFSFRNGYTLSSLCTRNTHHCHPTLKIGGDTFRIIYIGGLFVFRDCEHILLTTEYRTVYQKTPRDMIDQGSSKLPHPDM